MLYNACNWYECIIVCSINPCAMVCSKILIQIIPVKRLLI